MATSLLDIQGLHVNVGEREVLHGINLQIPRKETHVLMGPNACGKTTLALTILGFPNYKVTKGKILFEGESILNKDISQRAKLGMGLAFQNPPAVVGVKLRDILRLIGGKEPWDPLSEPKETFATNMLEKIGLDPELFLTRDINLGFSGGEKKRSELAQIFAMKPKLMVLDEPDSGVDIDSLKLIGNELRKAISDLECSVLIITHHRYVLQYLNIDAVHIMHDGRIIGSGKPDELVPIIENEGYESYIKKFNK